MMEMLAGHIGLAKTGRAMHAAAERYSVTSLMVPLASAVVV